MKREYSPLFPYFPPLVITLILLMYVLNGQAFAQGTNLVKNGGFEDGFVEGLGVAKEWGYFHTDNAVASFYDDTWELVVVEGEHAQLIELVDATSSDAYAGIYQTVKVTPDQTYRLSFKGLVRSDAGSIEASDYGFRMQYAIDQTGNQDWREVTDWVELPWDEQPRTGPADGSGFTINSLEKTFTADGDSVTIFIRAWKKWADGNEGNYDIDAVRLVAVGEEATPTPTSVPYRDPATQPLPQTGAETQAPDTANLIWLSASALLILLLVGGTFWKQKRHAAEHKKDN